MDFVYVVVHFQCGGMIMLVGFAVDVTMLHSNLNELTCSHNGYTCSAKEISLRQIHLQSIASITYLIIYTYTSSFFSNSSSDSSLILCLHMNIYTMDSLHFTNTRVIKYYKHTQHTVTDLQTVIFWNSLVWPCIGIHSVLI